jgi:hypothetical protein
LRGGFVEKGYEGPQARERADREFFCLTALAGRLPLPEAIQYDASVPALTLREARGAHGQDLIGAGRATEVLGLLGSLLSQLQEIDPVVVSGLPGSGEVVVHGDFGPQNVLVADHHISVLLDWEFAHIGGAIEDLAWAEWIVRMHHPDAKDALPEFFDAAKLRPAWADRQAAMIERCAQLLRRAERDGSSSGGTELWRARLARTASWSE